MEPDRILIGRDGKGRQARLRLERGKDMYVSSNHLLLEVRPHNCFIMDSTRKNKTYVKRKGHHSFEELSCGQLYPLHDEDFIKLGPYTLMVARITKKE
ncbi:MAG: FHA domain-containing protein [Deltaproteobacteria bacterium]|nr:FHA domain-containing protein [Deltaproteobacteria bacterium]